MDARSNFCKVTVNAGYDAAATSITISPSDPNLGNLPDPAVSGAYNLVWWDWTTYKDPADDPNHEIVRVTSKTSNVLTVTRAQESTTATVKNTAASTYKMILCVTKKWLDDLDNASADVGEETRWVTDEMSTGAAGAVGDGVAIDTVPIQDHFTNGNLVIFPPGTYLVGEITGHSNLVIRGSGVGITTIKLKNSAGASNVLSFSSCSNVIIEDLTIDGNKSNNSSGVDGLAFSGCTNVTVRFVEVKNCKRHNINFGGTTTASIAFSSISTGADNSSFNIDGDNNMLECCRLSGSVTGIAIAAGTDDTIIRDCHVAATTTKVSNSGTNTHARGNVGWVTRTAIQSAELLGTSGTNQTQTTAHGLDVTPAASTCVVTLVSTGSAPANGNGYPNMRGPYIHSTDGTNVVTKLSISTSGDDANVKFKVLITIDALP